ncbi:Nucleotide-binding universal stress protein, UspA family [Quadrisphaera granulorum]|uniref:Nucleotide-binding universal stress UspA family protein n=1 Tax=Quadrisphaera granulorum TaxID=317664 RepID=A0A316A525_9ACTN|nr:universal stress protein [Quadrisphaera granulorum]PWJ52639.1 nucleotide-binding universal stress UspA family protein [Quadrisphaera granulorum]SZE97461.1 Nucleotide-binding universal stress protein, UspA family [Quadrisphaera granulorum]
MSSSPIHTSTDHRDLRSDVVVGVLPGQSPRVLREAAALAHDLDGSLLAVHVDTTRYRRRGPDGEENWFSIDPDGGGGEDDDGSQERTDLDDLVRAAAGEVPVTTVHVTGDPARELAAAAERVDARVVVVGAGAGGWRAAMGEVFSGSVAVRLAHHQRRPVLVVPRDDDDTQDVAARW